MLIFAQADALPATPTTIAGAFIAVCMVLAGLVGWLMRHVFLVTIPGLVAELASQRDAHAKLQAEKDAAHAKAQAEKDAAHEKVIAAMLAENKAQREAHAELVAEIGERYKAAADEERKLCTQQFALVNTALAGLTAVVGQERPLIVAELSQKITEAVSAYRHEQSDKLEQAVFGRELYLEKKKREALEEQQRQRQDDEQRRGSR